MDKIYEQTMLFDFYGELLTEHQRSVYEDALYHDLSLGEIAEERGISRQGVHDLLKRCDKILQEYESKLHLVERFAKAKRALEEIERLALAAEEDENKSKADTMAAEAAGMKNRLEAIRKISRELLKEL